MFSVLAEKGWQGYRGVHFAGRGDRSSGQADRTLSAKGLVLSFQHPKGGHNALRRLL